MRYREGQTPGPGSDPLSETMLGFGAVLGLIIGIVLVTLGIKGKQYWLVIWGSGLVLASIAYLMAGMLGFI